MFNKRLSLAYKVEKFYDESTYLWKLMFTADVAIMAPTEMNNQNVSSLFKINLC